MRLVRDASGRVNVVRSRGTEELTIVDPVTGAERTVSATTVAPVADESELHLVADAIPTPIEPPLATVGDPRALGILGVLEAAGPLPATTMLAFESLCESDLHGIVGELRAAGLVEEAIVDGRRGYRTTQAAEDALAHTRD